MHGAKGGLKGGLRALGLGLLGDSVFDKLSYLAWTAQAIQREFTMRLWNMTYEIDLKLMPESSRY